MANPVTMPGDLIIQGTIYAPALALSTASITDAMIAAAAAIQYTKVNHKLKKSYQQPTGTAIVAETKDIHIVDGTSGTVLAVKVAITGLIATGGDRTVDVDVQKSTGGGAFATILTGTVHFTNGSTIRAISLGTISSAALVAGDILRIVITVAGAAGNQAQGIVVELILWETPT
jgi:hypothetical protein